MTMRKQAYKGGFHICLTLAVLLLAPERAGCEETVTRVETLESGFYYTVQKGDTLWDLSQHFFDSAWTWPDLWGKNQDITNPHWIYPGDRIRLYRRAGMEKVVEAPISQEGEAQQQNRIPVHFFYPAIDSVGFVKPSPVSPSGIIFGSVKEDKFMISIADLVYIRPEGETRFHSGDRYTIFRTKKLKRAEDNSAFGFQHYLVGILQVIEVAAEYSVGEVVESYRHIEEEDHLMPYRERSAKIPVLEGKSGLEGRIVASEENQAVFADQAIVFIDKGHQDGVEIGQVYRPFHQQQSKLDGKNRKEILLSPVDFGEILVLHTEPTTATAVVTTAEKAIEPGTRFH